MTYRTGTKRVVDKIIPFPSELHARRWVRANGWELLTGHKPRRSDPGSRAA